MSKNTQTKIAKYVNWALKGVLYLTLLTPILVSSKYLFPFITTKTIYFRLIIELAVILYTILAMLSAEFKPRMTKLSWAVLGFGIIIFITGITGVDFYKTFWGTIERGEGFLTIAHLIIYFLILTWTLKSKKEWLNYISFLVGVGILVDIYAIFQRLNIENFSFIKIIHPGEGRLSATIGNAAFLGAFTLAQFFMSVFIFLKRKHWFWKIFGVISAVLNLYVLYQTQTRGAALALFVVSILLCLLYAVRSTDRTKKIIASGILIIIALSAVTVWTNRNNDWVQNQDMLRRLVTISKNDITTESRLLAWDTSWKSWQDKFILGYGWENYNIAFNKYFHAEIFKDAGSQLWFDRAHNTFFDVAVATGIFGILCYLSIFGIALYYLFKNLKYDFDFSAILMALLIAHFLQNIFVFDVLSTYVVLFTIFALINFKILENLSATQPTDDLENKIQENNQSQDLNYIIITIVIIVVAFSAYVFNIKPLQVNKIAIQALIQVRTNEFDKAMDSFDKAINAGTYQTTEVRNKLADNIIYYNTTKNGLSEAQVIANLKYTIGELEKNVEAHEQDVQAYLYLMAIMNKMAAYDSTCYNQVVELGKKALVLSPTRPQIYFEMGQAEISQNNFQEGIEYFKKGVDLNPNTMESHWNLMTAYLLAGENENADSEFELMQNAGYNFNTSKDLNRLFSIYLAAKQMDKALVVLEQLVQIDPTGDNYARLAAFYRETGQVEKALTAVQKAVELKPSLQTEANKFIELLQAEN